VQGINSESLLDKAEELEKKYEWLKAARILEKTSEVFLGKNDFQRYTEIQESVGFCYFKSAFQVKTNDQFRKKIKLAILAYEKVVNLLRKGKNELDTVKLNDLKAKIAYANSWFEFDALTKKVFLDKWWLLKSEVLAAYEKMGDQMSKAKICNDMLEGSADCRYWLGLNSKESIKIRDQLLSLGEQAIKTLTNSGSTFELARAYCWTSYYYLISNSKALIDPSKDMIQKGSNYSKKALEIAQEIEDAWLIGWAYHSQSLAADKENNIESTINFLKFQIKYGEMAKDHYLTGLGRFMLVVFNNLFGSIEEDPEKHRTAYKQSLIEATKAMDHLKIINLRTWNRYYPITAAYYGLSLIEPEIKEKKHFLQQAVKFGRKAIELTEGWSHSAIPLNFYLYTTVLYNLSEIEPNLNKKSNILREILKNTKRCREFFKAYPIDLDVTANNQYIETLTYADLSKITPQKKNKLDLLNDALNALKLALTQITAVLHEAQQEWLYIRQGNRFYRLGSVYVQAYRLTSKKFYLDNAIEMYDSAITLFNKGEMLTRLAESHWQKAKIYNFTNKHIEASKEYMVASEAFMDMSEKVPQLKEYYKKHAQYLEAWNQIEQARFNHSRENYAEAMNQYRLAATLHEDSKCWDYLAPNYYAWEQLEKGEYLSRKEEQSQANYCFKLALEYFNKAEDSIRKEMNDIESTEEKEQAVKLIKASRLRIEYCQARISIEKAKVFDKQGEYSLSSNNYGNAARKIKSIKKEMESEDQQKELHLVEVLCRAWKKMAIAEETTSSESYLEAASFFDQAKELSGTRKSSLWAFGNSSFCKGLAAGIKYQTSLDIEEHNRAKAYIKNAATNYLKAGYKNASEYAKATQRLFDAYLFMNQAEGEADTEKRVKQYQLSENLLQLAAGSFMKAKHPEKTAQVQQILENVREEKQLAISFTDVLQAPTIASSTSSFSAPTSTSETSVGLEQFAHANVQANLVTTINQVKIGESFCLTIEFVNAGRQPALIMKVDDFIPSDFIVVKKPKIYRIEESCLNMKGKQLAPLKLVEVKVTLQPSKKGEYRVNPMVHYLNELGQKKSLSLKTLEITVEEMILADRVSTGTLELDSLLLGGIPKEYAVVFSGPPCDERELLIKNFLEVGAKQKEVTFYVATEANDLEGLLENPNFFLFLCNPKPKVEVPDLPNVYKLQSKTDLTHLSIALTKTLRNIDQSISNKRICIENLSDVLGKHGTNTTKEWISGLITDLGAKGFTMLAIMDPKEHPPDQATTVLNLFDGEISILQSDDPLDCRKSIVVKKLRNQDYIRNPICLR